MIEPKYPNAFSEHFGEDPRHKDLDKYKYEIERMVTILNEMATKEAEVIDFTLFDNYEKNLTIQVMERKFQELSTLIQNNPETIR